jgi:L-alanine-DL-glutamate epimerase-like enolase superfamily enzyme
MKLSLKGHDYAKSAIDIACWDLLGHITQQSVTTLLGGVRQEHFPLYAAVPLGQVEEMTEFVRTRRGEGIRRFQLKLGADPHDDAERVRRVHEESADDELIVGDANGGWRMQDAVIAARLLDGLDRIFLEQPCPTLEECAVVRARTTLPMILDEVITDVNSLLAAWRAHAMEAFNLKISKVGGLSKARLMRDLAEVLGLRLTIEDTWGGDIATAAIAHLAASTSPEATFMVSFVNDLTIGSVAGRQPHSDGGFGTAPTGAGLGVEVDLELLGKPLFSIH